MIKFSCEKVFLQNAIAVTSRAVAQKSSIPALEGLLIHADQQLTISGYNMQTGIRTNVFANVVEGGDIVLNARLFGDIIRRMPDDMITFTADEKMMVHVSCGDADFDILGLSAADYPDLPEVEDEYAVSMQQKVLRSMIEEVAFAVSTNESRPVHTGALLEIADMSLSMVAVDGFRLAFRREKLEKLKFLQSSPKRDALFWLVFMVPGTPKDLLCYFAGLTDLSWGKWLLLCTVGRLPSVLTSTIGGDALGVKDYQFAVLVFAATLAVSAVGLLIYRALCRRHQRRQEHV